MNAGTRRETPATRLAFRCVGVLAFAAFLGLPSGTHAQTGNPNAKVTTTTVNYGGWRIRCVEPQGSKQRDCSATFRVIDKQSKANVLIWSIGRNAGKEPIAELSTPTGILIGPSVQIRLDEEEVVVAPYVSCQSTGCLERAAVTDKLVEQVRKAKKAAISFTNLSGKVITVTLELAEIDKVLAELQL